MRSAKDAARECLALIQAGDAYPAGTPKAHEHAETVFKFIKAYAIELIHDLVDQIKSRGIRDGNAILGQARLTDQRWNAFVHRVSSAGHPWIEETTDMFRMMVHDGLTTGPNLARLLWPTWVVPSQNA